MQQPKTKKTIPVDIDEYIAGFPTGVQKILQEIRFTIKKAAPKAEETIRYGMPTFIFNGKRIYFATYKNHIGFYSVPTGNKDFEKEFAPYKTGKGSIQFPIDKPIPLKLISKIVRFKRTEKL
jgi:uncharacterized protein YdhG (YjbR/CyaY superfamily)